MGHSLWKKIVPSDCDWLLGPFGKRNGIGLKFIEQLAEEEGLIFYNEQQNKGLIRSIDQFKLSADARSKLSEEVADFYVNTSAYDLKLSVKWNPIFKLFGRLLRILFSKRIEQLNVPIKKIADAEKLSSEIIQLVNPETKEVKRTIWLRAFR